MQGKGSAKAKQHRVETGVQSSIPKAGDANCGTVTVVNNHDFSIVVSANNGFMGPQSSANIPPKASVVMPIGICAAVDLFAWYGNIAGVNWEGQSPIYVFHYHEVLWTVWVGQTATFGAQAAAAGSV